MDEVDISGLAVGFGQLLFEVLAPELPCCILCDNVVADCGAFGQCDASFRILNEWGFAGGVSSYVLERGRCSNRVASVMYNLIVDGEFLA